MLNNQVEFVWQYVGGGITGRDAQLGFDLQAVSSLGFGIRPPLQELPGFLQLVGVLKNYRYRVGVDHAGIINGAVLTDSPQQRVHSPQTVDFRCRIADGVVCGVGHDADRDLAVTETSDKIKGFRETVIGEEGGQQLKGLHTAVFIEGDLCQIFVVIGAAVLEHQIGELHRHTYLHIFTLQDRGQIQQVIPCSRQGQLHFRKDIFPDEQHFKGFRGGDAIYPVVDGVGSEASAAVLFLIRLCLLLKTNQYSIH